MVGPGLVGGHCIGVDPHYLVSCAESLGIFPEIMLTARRRNESVASRIVASAVKTLACMDVRLVSARVGVLGMTFKENVPDTRNSKSFGIIAGLKDMGITPLVSDPFATIKDCIDQKVELTNVDAMTKLDLLILAVPHRTYLESGGRNVQDMIRCGGALMDVRSALSSDQIRDDLHYWSL